MRISVAALLLFFSVSALAGEYLIIGDSLTCGSFGKQLLKNIADRGDTVKLYCTVSSAPVHWLQGRNPQGFTCKTMTGTKPVLENCGTSGETPKLADILASDNSATVIVALGTNTLSSGRTDATYRQMAQTVASAQRRCLWVAPPRMNESESKGYPKGRVADLDAKLATFYPSLAQSISTFCRLIDSRSATAPGTPGIHTTDGIHRTSSAGIFWANQLRAQY